jgi:iron complex outermembrane recepter protein
MPVPGRRPALTGILIALCVLVPLSTARAEDAGQMSETEFLGDIPVVLSAARLAQPVSEAPMATTIIDRDVIRASGFRQIADLLRLVPGMYVGYFKGDHPVVSYHGLSDAFSRRMQVLVDGRSVYMPALGGVEWPDLQLSVDDIERIEVIRGPDAASYGSNSFLGVVNIITIAPVQAAGNFARLVSGDGGTREAVLRHGGASGDLAYALSGGYRGDRGYYNSDGQRDEWLNLSGDWHPDAIDAVHVFLGSSLSHRNGDMIPCENPCQDNERVRSDFQQLRWTRQLADTDELSVQVFHDSYRQHESAWDSIPYPQPDGSTPWFQFDSAVRSERYDIELQRTHATAPGLRWVWGANLRREEIRAPLFFGTDASLSSHLARVFTHLEWHPDPQWLVQGGAMFEDTSIAGSNVSPNLAVNWHLSPTQTLRAAISRATRTPLMYEDYGRNLMHYGVYLSPNVTALGQLSPETILSRELGWLYAQPARGLSLDLKLFSDRLADLIDTRVYPYPPDPVNYRTTTYANRIQADQQGIEGSLELQPDEASRIVLNLAHVHTASATAAYRRAMPKDTVSLLALTHLTAGIEASLGYYQMSGLEMLQVFEPADRVPLMRRLDLRLAWHFGSRAQENELALTAQNLLAPYRDYFLYQVFDQRLQLSFATHF